MAYAEGSYDNLRAFIVPTSLNPNLSGGTSNGMTSSNNTTPTGWIDGGLGVLKGSSEWQNANFETGLQALEAMAIITEAKVHYGIGEGS